MKKVITIFCFIILLSVTSKVNAQYNSALGARAGKFASGISFKHMFGGDASYGYELFAGYTQEAKGGYTSKAFFVKQIDIHNSLLHLPLYLNFGIGGHIAYFPTDFFVIKEGKPALYNSATTSAGVDINLGVEWNSRKYPFTVGLDANPYYSLLNPGPETLDCGLTVRWIIN